MSAILQKQGGVASALTITTTTETLIAYSGRLTLSFPTLRVFIKGWLQIVYGTNSTGIILRIRRGNGVSGAVVAGGNTETAGVAAAAVADLALHFVESQLNGEFADYSLTAQLVAASANSTVNIGTIEVESING